MVTCCLELAKVIPLNARKMEAIKVSPRIFVSFGSGGEEADCKEVSLYTGSETWDNIGFSDQGKTIWSYKNTGRKGRNFPLLYMRSKKQPRYIDNVISGPGPWEAVSRKERVVDVDIKFTSLGWRNQVYAIRLEEGHPVYRTSTKYWLSKTDGVCECAA